MGYFRVSGALNCKKNPVIEDNRKNLLILEK
jgi:hypothetical protein